MLDKKKLQELEDEHALKMREFERVETDLDTYYYKFDRETNKLLEAISYACREVPLTAAQPYIFQIEDNLDQYHQQYKKCIDDVLEARYQENRRFQNKLDEESRMNHVTIPEKIEEAKLPYFFFLVFTVLNPPK